MITGTSSHSAFIQRSSSSPNQTEREVLFLGGLVEGRRSGTVVLDLDPELVFGGPNPQADLTRARVLRGVREGLGQDAVRHLLHGRRHVVDVALDGDLSG